MKVTAKLNNLRISPRKVREVADMVRGCGVDEAIFRLENAVRRSNGPIEKLINSAVANAENNFGLKREGLYISEIFVNAGPTLKRWMPRAFGRATQILKRTSKIEIVLEESKRELNEKETETVKADKKKETKKAVPTEGNKSVEGKIVETKKRVSRDTTKGKQKVEENRNRQLSREPGADAKIFKKRSDKK